MIGFVLLILACMFITYRYFKTDSAPIYMKETVAGDAHDPHDPLDADLIPNFVGASPSLI